MVRVRETKAQGFSELAALAEFQRLVLIMLGGCHSSSGYPMLVRVPVGTPHSAPLIHT